MPRNRGTHLVELAQVFAGTPVASEWAQKAAATRKARKAQLQLPGMPAVDGAEIERQRADLRCDLLGMLRGMGSEPRYVSVDEVAALGLPLLLELEELLAALPGGPNPMVLMKLRLAKHRLSANPSADSGHREVGHHVE